MPFNRPPKPTRPSRPAKGLPIKPSGPGKPTRPGKPGAPAPGAKPAPGTKPARPAKPGSTPAPTDKVTPAAKGSVKNKPAAKTGSGAEAAPETDAKAPAFERRKFINVYISLGSNMGKRKDNLAMAAQLLHENVGKIVKRSHIYETSPWGKTDQDRFLNQIVMLNTTLDPRDLLEKLSFIERDMGRERAEKWGPRPIDLDILFYGRRVVRDKGLEIPHPEIQNRAFILVPLMEMDGDFVHPVLGKQIDELYMDCTDLSEVVMLDF